MVAVSSRVRKQKTPSASVLSSAHSPAIGGKKDRLPVARISLSYVEREPSSACTTCAKVSIRTTRTPARRSIEFSAYQSTALR